MSWSSPSSSTLLQLWRSSLTPRREHRYESLLPARWPRWRLPCGGRRSESQTRTLSHQPWR